MKSKVYYTEGLKIWHRVANVDDLLDEKRHKPKGFNSIKELLGISTDRAAKGKAKEVIDDFLQMVGDDLIYNKDIFIFPVRDFGYMAIGDKTGFYHHRNMPIRDFFESGGKRFGPVLYLNRRVSKTNKKFYHMRFTRPFRLKLQEQIKSGQRYG